MKTSYNKKCKADLSLCDFGKTTSKRYCSTSQDKKEEISSQTPQASLVVRAWANHKQSLRSPQQNFGNSSSIKRLRVQRGDTKKNKLRSTTTSNRSSYHAVNALFSKPLHSHKTIGGHVFREAISQVKPCMDLRQVRRGRKVFQIPRVIPPANRELFGVRRLLSVLTSTKRQNVQIPTRGTSSVSRDKREAINNKSTNQTQPSSQKNLSFMAPLKKGSHTRTTLFGGDQELSASSLAYSLGKEIKASSHSRSRSIENKKRVYRAASGNRGSIRMAWWL